jgi:cobalt-zinc-cadmium efflux system membrane fusion protein
MTGERRLNVSPLIAAATLVAVLVAGAGGTYLIMRDRTPGTGQSANVVVNGPRPPLATVPPSDTPLSDVVITLTKEAVERAGIRLTPVSTEATNDRLRLPGVVEPNGYRQVSVTPLVSGRVLRMSAQLGDRVKRGQPLAQVYSPELAEARTKYIAARAMLDAHDRELQRTEKLVEIGAASRQELERIHAEHAAQIAELESARSRLQLLGADADQAAANAETGPTVNVPSPIDGVVTERFANPGLNVDPGTKLLTIVDLSNVWVIADVYERDLHRVREGVRATVTTNAYSDRSFEGTISYIDPQLNTGTRTAKVRIEVANPRGELRLGMYTDVAIAVGGASSVLSVPKGAIQNIGDRQVVYLPVPEAPAKFIEREVRVGRSSGDILEVLSGLAAGDSVVSTGSFFVRAEAERLGLRGAAPQANVQTARIVVSEQGFEPAKVTLRAGVPARLSFVRTTDNTCGTEVVFPSLNIKRALPLNQPVEIEFTAGRAGEIAFACGMDMLRGTVVVQ